jgi:hypothetical protein
MKKIELPKDYAQVLLRIRLAGEADLLNLAESIRVDRGRLMHIIENLQHKGLVVLQRTRYSDVWVRLSSKGRRLFATGALPALA